MQEVIARWDGFLGKIKQRFEQIMEESRQGCAMLFDQTGGDPMPMTNAWTGMESRAQALEMKVSDTFNDSVEEAFDDVDAPGEVVDRERDKGLALVEWMERERERVRIEIFAGAGKKLWEQGLAEHGSGFNCTQCGGQLQIPHSVSAINVACPYCSATVTFEPGTRLRMAAGFVHYLAEQDAWGEWNAWRDAQNALHDARNPTIDHFKALEHAQVTYWRKYLGAQASWLPEKQATLEADLRGKMRQWYDTVNNEKAWVQAGRPREIPFS
jgi:hypothetical protein